MIVGTNCSKQIENSISLKIKCYNHLISITKTHCIKTAIILVSLIVILTFNHFTSLSMVPVLEFGQAINS